MTSASTPSRSMSLIRRCGSLQRRMSRLPSSYIPVSAILSTRWFCPGTKGAPPGPTPFLSPKLAPFLATHCGPCGPSSTYGMRSFNSRDASDTKRSGGIHGMSRWQSAEILRYCIRLLRATRDRCSPDCTPSPRASPSGQALPALLFLPVRHDRDASLHVESRRLASTRDLRYKYDHLNLRSYIMHSTTAFALFALSLLPATALAQTGQQAAGQQAAAQPSSPTAGPTPSRAGALTREQYIHRAEERAAGRAAAQFDRMDTDHDGVLDPAERRAWRSQHPRGAGVQPAAPQ